MFVYMLADAHIYTRTQGRLIPQPLEQQLDLFRDHGKLFLKRVRGQVFFGMGMPPTDNKLEFRENPDAVVSACI
jgi:hypothetical protein